MGRAYQPPSEPNHASQATRHPWAYSSQDLLWKKSSTNFFFSSLVSLTPWRKQKTIIDNRSLSKRIRNPQSHAKTAPPVVPSRPTAGASGQWLHGRTLRCTVEGQFRVRHGDPSVMLPAFHSPPPTHKIQGCHGWYRPRTHRCRSQRSFLKTSPWTWARKHLSGLESWQQHPHWGLTSAASLQDARPGALGHRQSREHLWEEKAWDSQTHEQMS